MQLELTNIVTISVSETPQGIGEYNTSNLALFSDEPYENTFGTDGYKIYLDPSEVAVDFGTSSKTYQMALAVFSQQPNILAGRGYLVVIPLIPEVQTISFGAQPASGSFVLEYGLLSTAAIDWDATAGEVQTALRLLAGLEEVVVTGEINVADGLTVSFAGVVGDIDALTIDSNTLEDAGTTPVVVTVAEETAGEPLAAAITRTKDLVQYFGILPTWIVPETPMLAAAAVVQTLNKIMGAVSRTEADIDPGGALDLLRTGNLSQTRGLYYGGATDLAALLMSAAYFGRGLSTDFSGSNTTQTMHLKDLIGVQPDPSMTQTILNKAQVAGADVYASFQGVPKVFTSGANKFFDQVYNLQWLVGALQVAGFNYLAQSSTKIPQTEQGMDGLKGAYSNVLEQAVTNQFSAPGRWNSATTFGNQGDFLENISQRGYYIFSTPISVQSQAAREARQAPLVQIALKEAGAVQSSNVLVYVNA